MTTMEGLGPRLIFLEIKKVVDFVQKVLMLAHLRLGEGVVPS